MSEGLRAEQNFLGCLLRSPHEYWQIQDTITSDMLTVPHHRDVFNAIREVAGAGRMVSNSALLAHLPEDYDNLGPTIGILLALRENAIEAGSSMDYASMIAERAALSRLDTLAGLIKKEIKAGKGSEAISADCAMRIQEIMTITSPVRPKLIEDITKSLADFTRVRTDEEVLPTLSTGIMGLDEILGTVRGGDLGFIIAAQGDGKSALAAQIGMHVARSKRPVLYIQLEMSDEQMGARELAAASGIEVAKIEERNGNSFEEEGIVEAQRNFRGVPFYVVDTDRITIRQVTALALSLLKNQGLGLIVIDQLDKILAEGRHKDRFERTAELTAGLKRMAKFLKVPTITLAQRTRASQRRDDPVPHLLDADAPSIERDADWVIGLWQQLTWLQMNPPGLSSRGGSQDDWKLKLVEAEGKAEIISLKHRRRKTYQRRKLEFLGATMRYRDI